MSLAVLTSCRLTDRRADSRSPTAFDASAPQVVQGIVPIAANGGRVSWSTALGLVAFDRVVGRGASDIYVMAPDGSGERCLTCGRTGAPARHKGNPSWHPSGQIIVFQAEKGEHRGTSLFAAPGRGLHNDVWAMTSDGAQYFQLTDVPPGMGVLHPHFSPDGTRLLWAERVNQGRRWGDTTGEWAIKLADFVVRNGVPHLENVKSYQPGGPVFYETHGFSPDGNVLLYSATQEPAQPLHGLDIYAMDLRSLDVQRLTTTPGEWDEHAHFSPDGKHIVWMSSMGCNCDPSRPRDLKTDFWMMQADGTNKVRITYFNEPNHPHAQLTQGKKVAADTSWSPAGTALVAYVITGVDRGPVIRMDLDRSLLP